MLETWTQWTCDGCGETENFPFPNATKREVRDSLRDGGWKSYGQLDYCPKCVQSGAAKRRETGMGLRDY